MTTEATPKRTVNRDGPLTEFAAAEQIVRLIADATTPDLEAEVRAEVEKRRARRRKSASEQIAKRMARVPESKRENVAAHVLRALGGLGGFELAIAGNEVAPAEAGQGDDDFPEEPRVSRIDTPDPAEYDDPLHRAAVQKREQQADEVTKRLGAAGAVEPTERVERDETGTRRVGKGRT